MKPRENNLSYSPPLVSVVTPVYNGDKYLSECIESILNQTYENWEYIIVNNCSKDGSLKIAQDYAKKDSRIRVHDNKDFLSMVENFNHSLLQISDESKYCKVVHADDLLFPDCISKMVALAETNPSIGIVGSYVLEGVRIKCDGLPYPGSVFSGRDICRWSLIDRSPVSGGLYVFGSPTSLLIRSDLIRDRDPFYNERYLQVVDQEVCYYLLQKTDFGFLHDVLTFSRLHTSSTTSSVSPLNRLILEKLMLLVEFGPTYLGKDEYKQVLSQRMEKYYKFLSKSLFENKPENFWKFHREELKNLDLPLSRTKLANGALKEFVRRLLVLSAHPVRTFKTMFRFIKKVDN
ncbi:MAG: glycosyltransferase [Actinobacteria bacterium]|nr:glycosyltransferase [Actinomycetota bacterium]